MLKLELDWAGDEAPVTGIVNSDEDVALLVEYDDAPGPAGWPTVRVYAFRAVDEVPAHRESMALDAWLSDVYGCEDDEQRSDLLDAAAWV